MSEKNLSETFYVNKVSLVEVSSFFHGSKNLIMKPPFWLHFLSVCLDGKVFNLSNFL